MTGGRLEEEARKRKERLQALRQARQNTDSTTTSTSSDNSKNKEQSKPNTVEGLVDGMVETTLAERKEAIDSNADLDITTLAPRRANWDLKTELQQRLDDLKPRNDAAIADLIRKKIQDESTTLDT
ncbi:hypothetical protein EV175_000443 [Coemansia sp. RSA 1933]|nr:hypothetical protein EV175_000443 [Coemansia sp. RSA 1933]